jgi:flavin reductase (DIM6/NTAB) family NADH-FMN oxidoreductase RutF
LIEATGEFTVSILAGDQISQGQYFSYPGHRFRRAIDYFDPGNDRPVIDGCVAWLHCNIFDQVEIRDHFLLIADVIEVGEGRLEEPALTYSSRKGWRIADASAREPGRSVRDELLRRVEDTTRD